MTANDGEETPERRSPEDPPNPGRSPTIPESSGLLPNNASSKVGDFRGIKRFGRLGCTLGQTAIRATVRCEAAEHGLIQYHLDAGVEPTPWNRSRTIARSKLKRKLESRIVSQLLRALALSLLLGGLGHSIGVIHFYVTHGVPEANRVLLDTWVAEAQIIGGGLYLAAFRAMRAGSAWKGLAITGALTVLAYAVPFIPILFVRAPVMFRIPPIVYAILSAFIALRAANSMRAGRAPDALIAANGLTKIGSRSTACDAAPPRPKSSR